MANPIVENIAKTNADALNKSSRAAETIMKGAGEALTESGNTSRAAVQELTKAYQELVTKNAKNLTAAIQALSAVKSPTEFIELQQKLIKDGVSPHSPIDHFRVYCRFRSSEEADRSGAEDRTDLGPESQELVLG
jgi:Phasin protein